jgi:TonB family protein
MLKTGWSGFGKVVLVFLINSFSVGAQSFSENQNNETISIPRAGINGVGSPHCIYCPQPEYSEQASDAKVSGVVLLDVTVTADGRVIDPTVIRGPGYGLEQKALEQVRNWRMTAAPGPDGQPVRCRVQIEISFHAYQEPPAAAADKASGLETPANRKPGERKFDNYPLMFTVLSSASGSCSMNLSGGNHSYMVSGQGLKCTYFFAGAKVCGRIGKTWGIRWVELAWTDKNGKFKTYKYTMDVDSIY